MNLRLKSSGLDKYLEPRPKYDVDKIDESYIDRAIYKLFYIDVIQQIKIKALLSKQFHIPPSEVDKMPYWEYELWMKEINDVVKQENEEQEKQMDKYKINETMANLQSGKMTPKFDAPKMPKMPSFGTMKTPF